MRRKNHGSVAALQYNSRPELEFADIVEEFDIAFQMIENQKRSLTWDCDDVAILDRETIRVALGWLEPDTPDAPWYLIVTVGANTDVKHNLPAPEYYDALAKYIAERIDRYLPFDAVMYGKASRPIGSELIDVVTDLLKLSAQATPDDVAPAGASQGRRDAAGQTHHPGQGDLVAIEAPSAPKRLTVYAVSCTVMLQVPPIGAFMMVYAFLRDTVTPADAA